MSITHSDDFKRSRSAYFEPRSGITCHLCKNQSNDLKTATPGRPRHFKTVWALLFHCAITHKNDKVRFNGMIDGYLFNDRGGSGKVKTAPYYPNQKGVVKP